MPDIMHQKAKLRLLVLGALLVGTVVWAMFTQWRFQAIGLKLRGQLPTVSWQQIVSSFALGVHDDPRENLDSGLVTLIKDTGEGPCPTLWSTPMGEIWGELPDRPSLGFLAREQLIGHIYHNSSVAIAPGDVVVDVGGHLGTFTRFALNHGAAKVVVFEPEPRNIVCLKLTFPDEIRRREVVLVEAAAWKEPGVLHFRGRGATGQVNDGGDIEVQAVTIDDTVDNLALNSVDFIKMDIEGAEVDALVGARRTMAKFGPKMALSIYHLPSHPHEIPELVLAARPEYELDTTAEFAYFY